jgi:Permuted papain-like amidase enzyme, YaeF/YiiX, C92 family
MVLVKHTGRQLLGCLIFFAACNSPAYNESTAMPKADSLQEQKRIKKVFYAIDAAAQNIRTGDLIVRAGNDFTSESLRSLNQRDKTWSHCGIASVEHDTVFVYHALGGEWNPDQRIRKDIFKVFAEPYSNRSVGIYRYALLPADTAALMVTVKKLHQIGIMFDMKFDLQTNDRMYCAEFVYKAYVMGTKGKLQFTTSRLGDFYFVGVDDLFLQPLCSLQKKILYHTIKS